MARNLDPKCKQCRREGEKLFLKGERCFTPKCPIVKRNYPPGQHGLKGKPRMSSYGVHLREKQKVKRMYRLLEKQFVQYLHEAERRKGNTAELFLQSLEARLDNIVFRLGIADSRDQARQLVGHGHIQVNGKSVTIPSFSVVAGSVISVNPTKASSPLYEKVKKTAEQKTIPAWVTFDAQELKGTVQHLPIGEELTQGLQVPLIVEFYSR